MLTLNDVLAAQRVIGGRLHRTPLIGSAALSTQVGAPLYLKLESWQKTGSFKPRGVLNKIAALSQAERERGLITASAGNHAQALAAEHGYTFVAPFDDPAIVAGQGTVGLEILDDLPDVGTVVVPIGGGGLIAGIALAIKSRRPGVRIVGVEPRGAAKMWRSRQSGQPERLDRIDTIADGLSAPFAGQLPFALVQQYVDDLVLVDDADIRTAMALILERCKLLAEPGGAAALAGLLSGAVVAQPGAPAVAIVSGGNVDAARLAQLLTVPAG
jgi:threonine dehydratase